METLGLRASQLYLRIFAKMAVQNIGNQDQVNPQLEISKNPVQCQELNK